MLIIKKSQYYQNNVRKIRPFDYVGQHDNGSISLCLGAGEYKTEIFVARAHEGIEGNGYDWASLAAVFLKEKMPELKKDIDYISK